MLTLFHSPGSCSEGTLLLLEEIGAPYETRIVNVRKGDQNDPAYRALNSKGKVPALRLEDGSVLTEFATIAMWLGQAFPDAGVLPEGADARARVQEALDYIVGTVHMRAFTFLKVPSKFAEDPAMQDVLRAYGHAQAKEGLAQLSEQMGDSDFLLGDSFTAADAGLYYVLRWAEMDGVEMPANLAACLERLRARPAAQRLAA